MIKIALTTSVVLLLVCSPAWAQVVTDFDVGDEGWVIEDVHCYDGYTIQIATFNLTEHGSGGDPGGYVSHYDITSHCSFFSAPSGYLGDKTAFLGGKLEFSLNSTDVSWSEEDVVVLIGAGLVACHELATLPPAPPSWEHYEVPLTAAVFTYNDENGGQVTESDFALIMADVQVLLLPAEFGSEIEETVGLDSVRLSQSGTSGVAESSTLAMFTASPNPFNPLTTIAFTLNSSVQVELTIYDLGGRRVRTLIAEPLTAGRHEVKWHGRDDHGLAVASGVYLYRIMAGPINEVRRLVLVR